MPVAHSFHLFLTLSSGPTAGCVGFRHSGGLPRVLKGMELLKCILLIVKANFCYGMQAIIRTHTTTHLGLPAY
eukprot:scaffold77503_cov20-Prasinocladus_malaysianus.AAC.2